MEAEDAVQDLALKLDLANMELATIDEVLCASTSACRIETSNREN